ncbi:mechanosensitive ion channel family protein [Marivirga sp.]|uniref:mechanosensitive ion channel family protein n=1 Tax=Marivirga sp. TaxID=2018662 RepID=UPI002D80FF33|nr:mechanosensitive ion channel family protein [Marivirga sp.]HET8860009.1 mechanosensitive ion channel family protein [Marivirga sp.]
MEMLVEMIPNMLLSIILFIVFIVLSRLVRKLFIKVFRKSSDNKALENLFSTIIYYAMIGIGLFIILGILNLDKAVTSLLAGVGVVGLALGFAFQDIAANFVSGVILAFRKPFLIDDVVQVGDLMGIVNRTNLRVTVIRTYQGQEVYVPNKDVLSNPITNYSVLGERRIDLAVGVSYGENLHKVHDLVLDTLKNLEGVIRHEDMIFTYKEFGDSSINFEIKFWIKFPDNPSYLEMRSKAIMAVKDAFDEANITIPFPIRTLDFGIKGGKTLSEMNIGPNNSLGAK